MYYWYYNFLGNPTKSIEVVQQHQKVSTQISSRTHVSGVLCMKQRCACRPFKFRRREWEGYTVCGCGVSMGVNKSKFKC